MTGEQTPEQLRCGTCGRWLRPRQGRLPFHGPYNARCPGVPATALPGGDAPILEPAVAFDGLRVLDSGYRVDLWTWATLTPTRAELAVRGYLSYQAEVRLAYAVETLWGWAVHLLRRSRVVMSTSVASKADAVRVLSALGGVR